LRKYAVALAAVPILAPIVIVAVLRRWMVARTTLAIALGAVIGLGAIGLVRPTSTTATPPSRPLPLTEAAFRAPVGTRIALNAPMTITFSTPMDRDSVEASIAIVPATAVSYAWSGGDTVLAVRPTNRWTPDTLYSITIQPGALAQSGRPSTAPARTEFLTRAAIPTVVGATSKVGKRIAVTTAFTITFDRAVDPATVESGIRLRPKTAGTVELDSISNGAPTYTFTPDKSLRTGTRYRLVVDGVRDSDGLAFAPVTKAFRTVAAPKVVRFRPLGRTQDVPRTADISVRFTQSMDRATTKRAFAVTIGGKEIAGKIAFAEDDTVLVFDPKKSLPYDARVIASVAAGAKSADGVALGSAEKVAFRTVAKAKPRASTVGSGGGGGGSVGSGSWGAVERYYLRLMNCTRTGGWVDSGGHCDSPGGRNVAALSLSSGISSRVSRPYAKLLATRGECSHFIGGNPGDRLRRAGYTNYTWAENLGCRSGNPYDAVLGSHRFFQSEKPYNGGHYVNMMASKYDRAGIGVWVSHGRVRLVVDFYHP
jgi:hypothetical protein